jgi:ABC-2 type transport system ATP-binding protein
MAPYALSCRGLIKTFDATRVLDGLDVSVDAGTIFGLLGPNGSGKTTTIRTSLGIYRPDGGSVEVLGSRDSRCDAAPATSPKNAASTQR